MENLYLILKDYLKKIEEYARNFYDLKDSDILPDIKKKIEEEKNY